MTTRGDDHATLRGCEVVITRATHQQATLNSRLLELGAYPISAPTIALAPPPPRTHPAYRRAARHASGEDPPCLHFEDACALLMRGGDDLKASDELSGSGFDWIIFTSANAARRVDALWSADDPRLSGGLARALTAASRRPTVVCVGSSTRHALAELGVEVDLLPRTFHAEGLIELFTHIPLSGARILIPRALAAREALPRALRARGATVVITPVYQTVRVSLTDEVRSKLCAPPARGRRRYLTFTSDSTLRHLMEQLNAEERAQVIENARVVVIGPVVARAAAAWGLEVSRVACPHTLDGLITALITDIHDALPLT